MDVSAEAEDARPRLVSLTDGGVRARAQRDHGEVWIGEIRVVGRDRADLWVAGEEESIRANADGAKLRGVV